jgi:hypothetical protein
MVVKRNNAQLEKKNSSEQRTTQRYVMKMKMKDNIWEYFESIPDEYLVLLAELNWSGLEDLCILLTLDKQLSIEKLERAKLPS